MAIKKKRRRRRVPTTLVVITACKVDGKPRALGLSRVGRRVMGAVFDQRDPTNAKSGLTIDFGNGEMLHTALHALGVWTWGASDGDP